MGNMLFIPACDSGTVFLTSPQTPVTKGGDNWKGVRAQNGFPTQQLMEPT